ncbi:MAG TPA: hypothetical protein DCM05_02735 [Elusimicrobia bacterium]|nr:hypothetical protein [Elusimicrobiota bacterium]
MVTWKRLQDDAPGEDWDAWLAQAPDANPFQARAWAGHKRAAGWRAERWAAYGGAGERLACLQALVKPLPFGRKLAWAPGGPLAGSAPDALAPALDAWLKGFRSTGGIYFRCRCHLPLSPERAAAMSACLRRPVVAINSGKTLLHDLSGALPELRARMSSKHRYYVKQAEKAGLSWDRGHSKEHGRAFLALYEELARAKGIGGRLFPPSSIESLRRSFDEDCLILLGRKDGAPVSGCLVLLAGGSAFYLMAATNAAGRKLSAAYAMVPALFEALKGRGVSRFDFGGIDPASKGSSGVDHFKRGFGGVETDYLGEWDWSSPSWAHPLLSAAAGLKAS